MVLPHYLRSTEINIPSNEKEQPRENINRQDNFSPESPELDIPLLLPRDSEALDASNCDNTIPKNQSKDWSNKEHGSSSFFQDAKVESLAQRTQIVGFVDQGQQESMFDQMFPSGNQNSDEWWEAQERGEQVDSTSEPPMIGPRTSCHCQVSSD